MNQISFIHPVTRIGKRSLDIVSALIGLLITLPLLPLIALAIRLDSPGPVLYRQLRVGRIHHDHTELFHMIKFRSMRMDAEQGCAPVWAQQNDPRVTRIGYLLRKTRLDELPQLWNVLRGEMSLVGPRPERPGFCKRLDDAIPFYCERTFGVPPGITGLAQVHQGYDQSIEDVRNKIAWDHAYALCLSSPWRWLCTDLSIAARTVVVMVCGRGQ